MTANAYSPFQVALITLAIGFGGLGLPHINDSGFWIVTKYLGMSIADGLKTWTILITICGVADLGRLGCYRVTHEVGIGEGDPGGCSL